MSERGKLEWIVPIFTQNLENQEQTQRIRRGWRWSRWGHAVRAGHARWWHHQQTHRNRHLHLESSKQNYYIISLWVIIKAIFIQNVRSGFECQKSVLWSIHAMLIGFMLQKSNKYLNKKNEIFVKLTKEDLWWYVLREMGCFWNSSNQLLYNKFIQCECHLPLHPSLSLNRTPTYTFPHTPFWTLLFLLASQFLQWGKQTYNRPAKG